jgi:glycosyltransferase involved in cell wall biosynthesis
MDISVIIPVFNGGRKIRRCVRALQRQRTKRTYEIIVVDDGSTDGSLQCIKGNGVRIFKQANQGPAAARNLGVEKARGKIVLFTDADCEPLEDWIEQMVQPLEDHSISGVKGSYLSRQKKIVSRFVQLEYECKYNKMKRDCHIDFIDTYAAGFIKKDFGYRMVFNPAARVYHTHSDTLWNYMKKKFRIGFWKALVLKSHPKKLVRDSHTPQTLKLEMAFAMLFLSSLFLSPVSSQALFYGLFPLAGFLVTICPFVLRLSRQDPAVALFAPFLLSARAVSLSFGLILGTLRLCILNGRCSPDVVYATKRTEETF